MKPEDIELLEYVMPSNIENMGEMMQDEDSHAPFFSHLVIEGRHYFRSMIFDSDIFDDPNLPEYFSEYFNLFDISKEDLIEFSKGTLDMRNMFLKATSHRIMRYKSHWEISTVEFKPTTEFADEYGPLKDTFINEAFTHYAKNIR